MSETDVHVETEHLILRELSDGDFEGVHAYASDPEVVALLSWGPNTEDETKAFLQAAEKLRRAEPRQVFALAIATKDDDHVVGACRLVVPVATERIGKITYVLAKEHWRRGFMAEAVEALIRFGFDSLKLNRIVGTNPAENWGSALVLEKAGMQKEGRYDEHLLGRDGKWVDAIVYAAVRGQWPAAPPQRHRRASTPPTAPEKAPEED